MVANKSDRLVKIAVARDEFEANVWKDALEQEGITPYIKNLDPLTPLGVAGTNLPVFFVPRLHYCPADQRRSEPASQGNQPQAPLP